MKKNLLCFLLVFFTVSFCASQNSSKITFTDSALVRIAGPFQTADEQVYKRPYADFHIHTSFKHYYRDIKSVNDIMDHCHDIAYLKKNYGSLNWQHFAAKQADKDSGVVSTIINYDQSNFNNLLLTPGSVLCTSLYPYEKQFAVKSIKRKISHYVVSGIPKPRLKEIGSKKSYPLKEFLAEYTFLSVQDVNDPGGSGIKIELAKDNADLRRILADKNAIAQVISIEGGQVLYGPLAGKKKNVRKAKMDQNVEDEILASVETLRQLPHKVFFLTPSHFTDNAISGFCKTIDRAGTTRKWLTRLSKSTWIRKSFFTKFGEGIHGELDFGTYKTETCKDIEIIGKKYKATPKMPYTTKSQTSSLGEKVFRSLLKADNDVEGSRRILIDVKHMDIQARFEYYRLVDELNKTSAKPIPIIAGHVAVSGENLPIAMATGLNPLFDKYQEVENPSAYYQNQLENKSAYWLCWTSHLKPADQEKFFIDKSKVQRSFNPFALDGGIDKETAGWFYPWSINLCNEEIKIIYESNGIIGLNFDERILGGQMLNYSDDYKNEMAKKFNDLVASGYSFQNNLVGKLEFEDYYKCEALARNILYIVAHCGRASTDTTAWNHIAIGSDFDGLIDPINLCPTAEKIPEFYKQMVTYLEVFWLLHKDDAMFKKRDLFFSGQINPVIAMNKFFYENGRNFILNNF